MARVHYTCMCSQYVTIVITRMFVALTLSLFVHDQYEVVSLENAGQTSKGCVKLYLQRQPVTS